MRQLLDNLRKIRNVIFLKIDNLTKKCYYFEHIITFITEVIMDYQRLVKKLRKKLILSQQELAELLEVSLSSINRWETGKHEPTILLRKK
jgi:DNA-binding XRE family transcriptional regulator